MDFLYFLVLPWRTAYPFVFTGDRNLIEMFPILSVPWVELSQPRKCHIYSSLLFSSRLFMSSSFPCLSLPFSSPPLSSVLLFSQHDFSPLHSMIVEVKTKRQIRQKNYGNYLSPEIFSPQRDLFGCGGTFPTQKKYPHSQKRPYGGEKFRLERKSLWRKARIFRLNLTWTMRHWENWDCWNFDFNVQLFIYLSQILIKCICCTVQIRNTSSSLSHTHSHMDIGIRMNHNTFQSQVH